MRTFIKRSVAAAGFLAAISGIAFAADGQRQQANIPFSFVVNGQTLPAGTYSIERPRDMEGTVIMIQNEGGDHASIYALVTPAPADGGDAALVFARTAAGMRLSQVGAWSLAN